MDVSAKNNCAEGIQQIDCSVITNFGKLQACPVRNTFLKKCNGAVSKVCCAFCQSVDITEVCSDNFQMPFLEVPNPWSTDGECLYFLEGVW
jgi:hypothetical protein